MLLSNNLIIDTFSLFSSSRSQQRMGERGKLWIKGEWVGRARGANIFPGKKKKKKSKLESSALHDL